MVLATGSAGGIWLIWGCLRVPVISEADAERFRNVGAVDVGTAWPDETIALFPLASDISPPGAVPQP